MLTDADDDKEITSRATMQTGVSFTGKTYALAVTRAGFYPDFQRRCGLDCAIAMADRTGILDLAGTAATRARSIEFHTTARLRNLPAAMALRTGLRSAHRSLSMTLRTGLKMCDIQLQHGAADRVPEADVDLILKVIVWLRLTLHRRTTAASATAEDAGKDVTKAAAARGAGGLPA